MNTNTWKLVPFPYHKKAIGSSWVFKLKLYAKGFLERYKASWVAIGFTQTEFLYYLDTFNPVVKMTTITIFMAIIAAQD